MKKRVLSWGMILSLLLTSLPVSAVATEENVSENGQLAAETVSEVDTDAADSSIYTVEDDTSQVILDTPTISCTPLDEESSSDMVLTVEGKWDSYKWESCVYGLWSDWIEDGPSLTLSKEDFTSYGFRCTVTRGEQAVTSEPFAYDPSVLEHPMMVANSLSDDALYGSSDYIKFGKRLPNENSFNIKGLDNGYEIQTTYADAGYRTAISVNGGTKRSVFYKGEPVSVGNSLTAETGLEIVYGGRYVKITYEVTNNGSTTQNFRIGSSADVMIDNNDHAEVVGVKSSTGDRYTGLSMNGNPKNNYKFSLVAPDCDTLWYGYYSKAYINIFNDLSDKDSAYSKDSGMAWSWSGSVAPGQTWSRFVLIGAGDLPPAPDVPQLDELPDLKAGEEFTISGTVNLAGNPPDTVHISVSGKEYEARVGEDGTFAVTDILPEDMPAGETTLTYWGTTDGGGISEIQSEPASIEAAPFISLTTSSVTVTEGDAGLDEAWLNSFIKVHSDPVDIYPSTIDTNISGKKTVTYSIEKEGFSPATAQLTVIVLPKPAELTQTTVSGTGTFALSSTMVYTGGLTYKETGFVYGALQNPTLTLNDGQVKTSSPVNTKGGQLTATVSGSALAYGVNYYARAYAIADDGTVIYSDQSSGFGMDAAQYGAFSVANSGNTFTITRSDGTDGEQTVYYRTVNGSAIGGTHFEHKAGSVNFEAGETTKSVTVMEKDVFSTYGSNAATAYSNANRTYFFEIYRVTGGATINSSQKSATRTMTVSSSYHVDGSLFNEYRTSTPSGETSRGDFDGVDMGWTNNESNTNPQEGSNAKEIVTISNILPVSGYTAAVAQNIQYKLSFQAKEVNDGYQHIQVSPGEGIDLSQYPFDGEWKGTMDNAAYAAIFEHGGSSKNESYQYYTFPNYNNSVPNFNSEVWGDQSYKGNGYVKFPMSTEKMTVGFAGSGSDKDEWTTKEVTHYLKYLDTKEPQLLGVAPMADGSYLPGDSVTVALVFDEIVDSANSPNLGSVQIATNWGIFTYAGGADTNVLYFTGTVSDTASGTLTVNAITNAENIKDMAEDTGTATGGTVVDGNTDAALGNGADAPNVMVGQITNANGTLTGTISATNAAKLEYAWSMESDEKDVVGWKLLADTSGGTVSTRQASGIWYLHARATNNDGVTDRDSQSISLEEGGGTVELPSLAVTANNDKWAKNREIAVTCNPANATVQVKTPDGTNETISGSIYTAQQNGTYTFTLKSGDDTITKMVTVSKLDTTAPTVAITDLSNLNHTEAITLTVRASDGESGIQSVTGTWHNGSDSQPATISGGTNGVYATTSPDGSGTWTLHVTATDNVGNSGTDTSLEYTINAARPGLTVTKQSESHTGVVYHYTVTENGNTDIIVTLPDGSITTNLTGTFTITEPGDYAITVTDAAAHFVSEDITVTVPEGTTLDGVPPDVRLSIASENWTQGPVTVTVSVYDAGSAGKILTALHGDETIPLTETNGESGSFTGNFEVSANGIYTVTCTDSAGNEGSGTIEITNIDITDPVIAVSGNPTNWTADDVTITLSVTDDQSGVDRVEVKKEESTVVVAKDNGGYIFTVSENGIYTVTATDKAGNTARQMVKVNKIDKSTPILKVTGGTESAASLNLTVTASAGDSGVTVTVQKDGGTAEEISGDTYPIASVGTYTFTATTGAGKTVTQTIPVHRVTIGEKVQLVVDGGKVTEPADPVKDGYIFDGWYDGDTLWNFDEGTVTKDLTLTAHWTMGALTVTLSADKLDAVYNGGQSVITLNATAAHGADVTFTYEWYRDDQKLDGKTGSTLALSTVADSGKYTVRVIASADGQSAIATSNAVTVTISKADPTITVWPEASDIIYGDNLGQSTLSGGSAAIPGSFVWKDSSITPNSGFQDCTMVFTPSDTDNYNTTEQIVTVTVAKKTLIPDVVSVEDKEYDGGTSTTGIITLNGAVPGDNPAATGVFSFDNANAGQNKTVTVVVVLEGEWGSNYALSTTELTATASVTKKTVGLAWHGYENLTYTGQPVSVAATATGLVTGDTCTVMVEDGDKVDVGSYTAEATGLSNPNYQLPTTGTTKDYIIAAADGTASVTMEGWTYGDAANRPVPVSATNGIDNVTYYYDGRAGTVYSSDTVPTDAGNYTVTATFAATANHEAVTAKAEFTIAKKPITATWSGLNQVYGNTESVMVSLSGVLDGDDVEIRFTGVKETAGRHALTAILIGADIANYTLKNSTAMLTIQPKPVIFTVTGSAVQADGSEKRATITADDIAFTDYAVSYWQNGKKVSSPKDVGSYEIWVEIANPNYHHSNGSDTMQVGTLTITQAPPVLYTVSFAGGEGAAGIGPAQQTALAEGHITLPANPFTRTGYRFSGWKADGDTRLYQPGDSFTMPARNVTFIAQWQDVYSISGIIKEQTDSGEQPAEGAIVSIWLGANHLAEAKTDADGSYSFSNLLLGIYNLVVDKDVRTVTQKVIIDDGNTENCNVTLPKGATNSIVEVLPGSPDIVVGKLDTVFHSTDTTVYTEDDQKNVNEGGKVEITFIAEEKTHAQQEEQVGKDIAKIEEISDGSALGLIMDYKLEKTVTTAAGVTSDPTLIPQANVLLEVLLPLPTELQGKDTYSVYRVHSSTGQEEDKKAQELKQGEANKNELGEYFTVNSDKTRLTLYVKCFSTYAIGYTESSGSSGGSNAGGGSSAYPPSVEQTEHGSVTTSPKNPVTGDLVTITPDPDEGYAVDEVIVTDSAGKPIAVIPNNDGTYTFIQPIGKVTITVTFSQMTGTSDCPRDDSCPMAVFYDTELEAWYHDGVHYCLENDLMLGTGKATFEPDTVTTRGMIVTILWRLEGSPMVNHPMDYDDVKPEDWYGKAVCWADSAGVVTGYGNGKFGPNDPITREQMAAMLWRYAGSPDVDGSLSAFVDGAQVSDWAQSAMIWAVDQELLTGVGHNQLATHGQATRAQAATILMRFSEKE